MAAASAWLRAEHATLATNWQQQQQPKRADGVTAVCILLTSSESQVQLVPWQIAALLVQRQLLALLALDMHCCRPAIFKLRAAPSKVPQQFEQ